MVESMRNISTKGSQSTSFVFERVIDSLQTFDTLVVLESLVEVAGEELPSLSTTGLIGVMSWDGSCWCHSPRSIAGDAVYEKPGFSRTSSGVRARNSDGDKSWTSLRGWRAKGLKDRLMLEAYEDDCRRPDCRLCLGMLIGFDWEEEDSIALGRTAFVEYPDWPVGAEKCRSS